MPELMEQYKTFMFGAEIVIHNYYGNVVIRKSTKALETLIFRYFDDLNAIIFKHFDNIRYSIYSELKYGANIFCIHANIIRRYYISSL